MKVIVPLASDALLRVDKLDKMVTALEANLPTLKRSERHKCQKTIDTLRHKLNKECIDALLREGGVAPVMGTSSTDGYRVTRGADGKVNAVIWGSTLDS